ncbi:iron uptake system protein EfeO [Nocardioides dongxiaopingii]|uniref:iron uptake system protein EfeO n=1 Tax=Nocardioides dongxiaopingii TaxID=2576036 RepID=UPI001BB06C19|nr:iron uptake system protein EfeO [Nocardioides dongxiaopingii]
MKRILITAAGLLVAAPVLAACGTESTEQAEAGRAFTVESTDDACTVSGDEAPAGTLTFEVSNQGSDVTEFYLLGQDGLRILGEVENIGADSSNTLTVNASAGEYFASCKPGMKGEGIRSAFTVTASEEGEEQLSASDQELVDEALAGYKLYVRDQSAQLLEKTREFVELYKAGDQDDAARALYPVARTHWERIETVAESFGDLDPKMDLREADLEPGQEWTGWHKLEKDLWPADAVKYRALTPQERATFADDLLANTETLDEKIQDLDYTIDQLANGSRGLLEEVAVGKVTGEEEFWSHTDLWDFQANVDGARVAFDGVQPIVEKNDPELAETLTTRFDELQTLLDAQREGDGFKLYTDLTPEEVKGLSNAVDALAEPLGRLTAAVV